MTEGGGKGHSNFTDALVGMANKRFKIADIDVVITQYTYWNLKYASENTVIDSSDFCFIVHAHLRD